MNLSVEPHKWIEYSFSDSVEIRESLNLPAPESVLFASLRQSEKTVPLPPTLGSDQGATPLNPPPAFVPKYITPPAPPMPVFRDISSEDKEEGLKLSLIHISEPTRPY